MKERPCRLAAEVAPPSRLPPAPRTGPRARGAIAAAIASKHDDTVAALPVHIPRNPPATKAMPLSCPNGLHGTAPAGITILDHAHPCHQ